MKAYIEYDPRYSDPVLLQQASALGRIKLYLIRAFDPVLGIWVEIAPTLEEVKLWNSSAE
jgi:hypothetical protein